MHVVCELCLRPSYASCGCWFPGRPIPMVDVRRRARRRGPGPREWTTTWTLAPPLDPRFTTSPHDPRTIPPRHTKLDIIYTTPRSFCLSATFTLSRAPSVPKRRPYPVIRTDRQPGPLLSGSTERIAPPVADTRLGLPQPLDEGHSIVRSLNGSRSSLLQWRSTRRCSTSPRHCQPSARTTVTL